jgi:hypothetical protein
MKRLLFYLLLFFFLFTGISEAANKIRAFTEIEGGGAGALDAVPCADWAENDLALVYDVNSTSMQFYWFDDGAEDDEDTVLKSIIRPDNYATCGDGVLKMMKSFVFGPSSNPQSTYYDLEATDFDKIAYWSVDCSAVGSGAEDCGIQLYMHRNGTPVVYIELGDDTTQNYYRLYEAVANGDNYVQLISPAALGGDRILTLPDATDTLVGKATTDELTYKTIDANGTGNVIKGYGYITLTHPHSFGSGVTQQTTATDAHYGQALFSNSADKANNYLEYWLEVPRDIDTSVNPACWFKIQLSGADTGDHEYEISMISIADSAAYDGTAANAVSLAYTADASGASGDAETATAADLTAWESNVTAGHLWKIRMARDGDHANDTSTVDSYSGPLTIRYGFTQ